MESGDDSPNFEPTTSNSGNGSDNDSVYNDKEDGDKDPAELYKDTIRSGTKRKQQEEDAEEDASSSSDQEDGENPTGAATEAALDDVSNNTAASGVIDECLEECLGAMEENSTLKEQNSTLKEQIAKLKQRNTTLNTAKNKAQKTKRETTAAAKKYKEESDKMRADLETRLKAAEREHAALRKTVDELNSDLQTYQTAIPCVQLSRDLAALNGVNAYISSINDMHNPDAVEQYLMIDTTSAESQTALQQVRDNNPAECQGIYCQCDGVYDQFHGKPVEVMLLKAARHEPTPAGRRAQKASLDKRLAIAIYHWNKAHPDGEPPSEFPFDPALHAVLQACYVYDKDAEGDEVLAFFDRIGLIDRKKGLLACIHGNKTTIVLPNQRADASMGCTGLRWTPTFGRNGAWFGRGFYFELRPCNPANWPADRPSSLKCTGCGCLDKSTGYCGFPERPHAHGEKTGAIVFFWVPVPGNPDQVLVRGEDPQISSSMSNMTGHPGSNPSGTTSVLHVVPHHSHPASTDPNQKHAELILTFHGFYSIVGEPIPTMTFIISRPMVRGSPDFEALKHAVIEFGIFPHLQNFFMS